MITGFLHPGEMGSSVAAACAGRRIWASEQRSEATVSRAEAAGIEDVVTVRSLVDIADTIVSVCPPEAALDQARQVAELGFTGVYVDANATSPATAKRVASMFDDAVDGGIVGPPAVAPGTTRLYLSGSRAGRCRRPLGGISARRARHRRRARRRVGPQDVLRRVDEGHRGAVARGARGRDRRGRRRRSHRRMGHLTTGPLAACDSCRAAAARRRPGVSPARWTRSQRRSATLDSLPDSTMPRPRYSAAWPGSRTPHRHHSTTWSETLVGGGDPGVDGAADDHTKSTVITPRSA